MSKVQKYDNSNNNNSIEQSLLDESDYKIISEISKVILQSPEIASDSKRMHGVLADILPGMNLEVNLLSFLIEHNIFDSLKDADSAESTSLVKYVYLLEDSFATPKTVAQRMINILYYGYKKTTTNSISAGTSNQLVLKVKPTVKPVTITSIKNTQQLKNHIKSVIKKININPIKASVQNSSQFLNSALNKFKGHGRKMMKYKTQIIIAAVVVAIISLVSIFVIPNVVINRENTDNTSVSDQNYSRSDRKQINSILTEADEAAEAGLYEDAVNKVNEGIASYPDSELLSEKLQEYTRMLDAKKINGIIADAESYASNEYYEDALNIVQEALKTYPDSTELKQKSVEYSDLLTTQITEKTLSDAKLLAESGKYSEAMTIIQSAIDSYGENAEYKRAYDSYNSMYLDKVKEKAISQAIELVRDEDFLGAYDAIKNAMSEFGDDATLSSLLKEYEEHYVTSVISQVDEYKSVRNYTDAQEVIQAALKQFPNNTELKTKQTEIENSKPVSLASITALNSGYTGLWKTNIEPWNDGAPIDPFGNDYSHAINYSIVESYGRYNTNGTSYAEYRLYGKYNTITGKLCPYTSIEEDGDIYIRLYADDQLIYTSPVITRKTDIFEFSANLNGAEYIKIVAENASKKDQGSLIMSDFLLWVE